MSESSANNNNDRHRQRSLSLSIASSTSSGNNIIDQTLNSIQLQHKLPTPVSPTTTTHNFGSLVSQFSIKPSTSNEETHKLYTCIECGQNFNRAHNLKSHRATHSASKPYQCSECEKHFLRFHDLKRHQKLHTGERPYQCPVCERSFSRLDALNRHRKTEGGSACIRSSNGNGMKYSSTRRVAISPGLPPTLSSSTSQWQLNSSSSTTLPSPFLPKPNTTPVTTTASHSGVNSPTTPLPFILPFSNTPNNDEDEMDKLKQRIHDLEIENRVLRSLLCKQEEVVDTTSLITRRRSP
ncbi:hypothetical protein HMPREF1544_05819 [Mucor circinelloides 1006PhL]|uniref:C2H2-type domain-containing protein n=1 Tax=Mucor circinelloides f. circinelloides (strain 1006PhL) TaxID=1220926 RepID=S2JXB1_MUCC1|nr:hypothetical protein HMPREF1544_05819 [Mucor circinelloides 1006PhL]